MQVSDPLRRVYSDKPAFGEKQDVDIFQARLSPQQLQHVQVDADGQQRLEVLPLEQQLAPAVQPLRSVCPAGDSTAAASTVFCSPVGPPHRTFSPGKRFRA
jgi:hypothetical protein